MPAARAGTVAHDLGPAVSASWWPAAPFSGTAMAAMTSSGTAGPERLATPVVKRRPRTGTSVSDSARMICTATGTNCSAESKTM